MMTTRRFTRIGGGAYALVAYTVLTLALTYPLVRYFASAIPGDSFDGWQNYWNLWWVKTALLEQHTHPWFTNLLYHPTGVSLLFHTLNAFNGFTFLPVQLAWGILPEYNTVVVFSFAVGGCGAYLLARQVLGPGSSRLAAFTSGLVFTFAPYHIAHLLGHMQLIALEWLPFYALYLLRTVTTAMAPGRTDRALLREASLATLFLALVALCDWYYVFYCLILTAVVGVWVLVSSLGTRSQLKSVPAAGRAVLAVMGVWLTIAIAFGPLLIPMVREARAFDFMVPDPEQSRTLSADLLAFVTPQEFHPLWGAWAREQAQSFKATVSEHQVFAGFSVLALALIGIIPWSHHRRKQPERRGASTCTAQLTETRGPGGPLSLWLAILAVFFVLSLGPVLHIGGRTDLLPGGGTIPLPYALVIRLPFLDIMRSISRLDVMVMLALGVLTASGANRLARNGRGGRLAVVVALGLIVFEFLPAPYPVSPPDTPLWYDSLAADERPGAVLNLPVNWDRPGYLLYQTVHSKPLTAAYISRDDPRTLIDRAPVLQHFRSLGPDIITLDLGAQGRQVLADLGVRWVVLDRYKMPGGTERAYTEAAAAEIFGGQPTSYEDERIRVYEVEAPAEQRPYLILGDGWSPFDRAARTRSFTGRVTVLVMAPEPGQATLEITLASDSGPLNAPEGPQQLTLQSGANEIELEAASSAPVVVKRLALLAADE